jgi:hypothetical protein
VDKTRIRERRGGRRIRQRDGAREGVEAEGRKKKEGWEREEED